MGLMNSVQRLTLRQKLVFGFGYLLIILLIVDLHAIETQRVLSQQTQALVDRELMGLSHLKEANINLVKIGRALRRMMLATNLEQVKGPIRERAAALREHPQRLDEILAAGAAKARAAAEATMELVRGRIGLRAPVARSGKP